MIILHLLQCWTLLQTSMLIDFVCFSSFPPSDHIQSMSRTPTYPTVLTIVHFNGTSILSHDTIAGLRDLEREYSE